MYIDVSESTASVVDFSDHCKTSSRVETEYPSLLSDCGYQYGRATRVSRWHFKLFPELSIYLNTVGCVSSLINRAKGNTSSRWMTSWSRQLLYQWARCQRWILVGKRTISDSTTRWMWVLQSAPMEDSSLQLYLEQNQKWANEKIYVCMTVHDNAQVGLIWQYHLPNLIPNQTIWLCWDCHLPYISLYLSLTHSLT